MEMAPGFEGHAQNTNQKGPFTETKVLECTADNVAKE
jgi:hypothetical protein